MGIVISQAHELMKEALNYRAQRQDMIASNIANADTPFYRPRDINFEDMLSQKREAMFANEASLELASTNSAHLEVQDMKNTTRATLFFRDGHMARNDGNSVDIDVETTEMSKNSIAFNTLIASVKKSGGIFKSVIEASSKV
ncbi:MAG: flagellar basal body rod protein FlgB [Campylobacterota bacterium]|nr:flagellar basal body rod protein FlgB [Campylobacterota bacterium]